MKKQELVIAIVFILLLIGIEAYIVIGSIKEKESEFEMEYYNYTDLGIISSIKPPNLHQLIEATEGLFCVNSADTTEWYFSSDKGDNWTEVTRASYQAMKITGFNHIRQTSDRLYYALSDQDGTESYIRAIELSSRTDMNVQTFADLETAHDVLYDSGLERTYFMYTFKDGANLTLRFAQFVSANDYDNNMGAFGVRTWDASQCVKVGGFFWFLWKWSDENVELWKWEIATANFTEMEDLGAATQLPGQTRGAIAYDGSNILYFVIQDTGDSKYYLWTYNITTDTATKEGEYNVALMLDRNTASGVLEKAFHITEYKVYQLHEDLPHQLHLIANVNTDAVIIAITDNFLMNNDGDMFEYEDVSAYVSDCDITMEDMNHWSATLSVMNDYPLTKGELIVIKDMFTTAGASATSTIFEGYVESFSEGLNQVATLTSPAKRDLDEEMPSGDYSGRTDEIIVSLIAAHGDYITAGTMSAGTAMGTITFYGDKTLREILDEFAITDGFIWYLTPTGKLYYNNGTVDSVENFTETSTITAVNKTYGAKAINYANIKGGFVSGAQVSGTAAENLADQQLHGRNPYIRVFSHLDLAAQCTTTNTAALARYGTQAALISFSHIDSTVGVIQPGETITFQYVLTGVLPNIASDQFGIRRVLYKAKQGKAYYMVSDQIL